MSNRVLTEEAKRLVNGRYRYSVRAICGGESCWLRGEVYCL
ncbi:unnamed protein product [marine sediment metagenome]|uniref:Uncharacterized protein n=1 Tax=marine sediment metagenome TaxID=412755 RepID=X1TX01_9ZZZZ